MPATSSRQIDRAHREFSDEQIQNIAIISQLHKGRREKFVQLIDRYFAEGMERLVENKTQVEPVSAQLLEVLDDDAGKQAVGGLVEQWAALVKLRNPLREISVNDLVSQASQGASDVRELL